jgi:hypothetical protein
MTPATINGIELERDRSLQGSIDRLNHICTEAEANRIDAQRAYERSQAGAIENSRVAALREYDHGVAVRTRVADDDESRVLAGALCSEISQNSDLRLRSVRGAQFLVEDVGPARRKREADAALREATQARDSFLLEHAEQIAAEAEAAEAKQVFDALKSGSRERILQALVINQPPKALRTSDLSG